MKSSGYFLIDPLLAANEVQTRGEVYSIKTAFSICAKKIAKDYHASGLYALWSVEPNFSAKETKE